MNTLSQIIEPQAIMSCIAQEAVCLLNKNGASIIPELQLHKKSIHLTAKAYHMDDGAAERCTRAIQEAEARAQTGMPTNHLADYGEPKQAPCSSNAVLWGLLQGMACLDDMEERQVILELCNLLIDLWNLDGWPSNRLK